MSALFYRIGNSSEFPYEIPSFKFAEFARFGKINIVISKIYLTKCKVSDNVCIDTGRKQKVANGRMRWRKILQ